MSDPGGRGRPDQRALCGCFEKHDGAFHWVRIRGIRCAPSACQGMQPRRSGTGQSRSGRQAHAKLSVCASWPGPVPLRSAASCVLCGVLTVRSQGSLMNLTAQIRPDAFQPALAPRRPSCVLCGLSTVRSQGPLVNLMAQIRSDSFQPALVPCRPRFKGFASPARQAARVVQPDQLRAHGRGGAAGAFLQADERGRVGEPPRPQDRGQGPRARARRPRPRGLRRLHRAGRPRPGALAGFCAGPGQLGWAPRCLLGLDSRWPASTPWLDCPRAARVVPRLLTGLDLRHL